jgi:hypothetical protein
MVQGKRRVFCKIIILAFSFSAFPVSVFARMLAVDTARFSFSGFSRITTLPNLEQCTHKTGRLWFTVSNYGIFGNRRDFFVSDCLTGLPASSAEFPGGSKVEYLFQGGLWVGGIVGKDTLTSIGTDGWVNIRELFPDGGAKGSIIRRSARTSSPFYSPEAVSDLDLITVYYDTLKDPRLLTTPDPEDGRPHKPMGLKIEQRSYTWATSWGQDWVLLDFVITNLGPEPIKKGHVGLFFDPDIGHTEEGRLTERDDYCGFKDTTFLKYAGGNYGRVAPFYLTCTETLNVVYAYDNDGDPEPGDDLSLSSKNPTAAFGVRFLRAKEPIRLFTFPARLSFNWWVADSLRLLDWGPQKTPGRTSIFGGRGQPAGDAMRYHYLSNREVDYDQYLSALSLDQLDAHFGLGGDWMPPHQPPANAFDIADGADSRFVFSVGPFDLDVGESLPVTAAVFIGPRLHFAPGNFEASFPTPFDFTIPAQLRAYRSKLDLRGLIENSRMARRVFDNENIRSPILCQITPGGLFVYDSTRFHGDGIPDFKGPVPPPYPKIEFSTGEGEVTIRWFGKETETSADPVTSARDFEGYTVWMSADGVNFTLIGYFDEINWRIHYLNRDINQDGDQDFVIYWRWEPAPREPSGYDEIQNRYAVFWDTCVNKPENITRPINLKRYSSATPVSGSPAIPPNPWCSPDTSKTAIRVRFCDYCGPLNNPVDTLFYFEQVGLNLGMDKIKMYPTVTDPDNDSAYWYQFKMTGLLSSQPLWFAVSPMDNGFRSFGQEVAPQEAPPYAVARMVFPVATDSARKAEGLKISVYPNPYRIDHDYSYFEKKFPVVGESRTGKRINFVNLPPKCTIRIYTLDGDLVQQINHDKNPGASDSGVDSWNLLSRNAQPAVSGMYLFVVESAEGRFVGKILIIQ